MVPLSETVAARISAEIQSIDEVWHIRARAHLDTLTKPLGSLGRLEDIAARFIAIRRGRIRLPLSKAVYVFAADHGVTAEGVSAYPSAVTEQMVLNFLEGGAAINVLARMHGIALHIVDVGVAANLPSHPDLLQQKIAQGTANMHLVPAMNDRQVAEALEVGGRLASEAAERHVELLGVGEMGIGNTTSASVITCLLTGAAPEVATGKGTGLDAGRQKHKIEVVRGILSRFHSEEVQPTPLEILRSVGGLEIAAMTGMMLGAAQHGLSIVVDGFISTAAASLAVAIEPKLRSYLFAGHRSEEPGHLLLLEHLGLEPILSLGMRLGEGSGAALAMPVIESAVTLYREMATFASAGVSEASR